MSRFGQTLETLIESLNLNQITFAERLGVNQSVISRWVNGEHPPRATTLAEQILPQFTEEQQRLLLSAYLLSIVPPQFRHLVEVNSPDTTLREEPPATNWPDGISPRLQQDLVLLAALARDVPEIRAVVEEFAKLARKRRQLPGQS